MGKFESASRNPKVLAESDCATSPNFGDMLEAAGKLPATVESPSVSEKSKSL